MGKLLKEINSWQLIISRIAIFDTKRNYSITNACNRDNLCFGKNSVTLFVPLASPRGPYVRLHVTILQRSHDWWLHWFPAKMIMVITFSILSSILALTSFSQIVVHIVADSLSPVRDRLCWFWWRLWFEILTETFEILIFLSLLLVFFMSWLSLLL